VKVLMVHEFFIMYWLPRIKALSKYLRDKGIELPLIDIASSGGTSYEYVKESLPSIRDIQFLRLFKNNKYGELSVRDISLALWKVLERENPDVVLAPAIAFPSGATAVRWCRTRKRPVIIMDDVRLQDVPRTWLTNFVKRRIYLNVNAAFIPAPSHDKTYISWGLPQNRLFYGLDCNDNDFFRQRSKEIRQQKEIYKINHSLPDNYFLCVCRLLKRKNLVNMILAYGEYRHQASDSLWDLVLVGDGPQKKNLEELVLHSGIKGVHFFPWCDQNVLCEYYALARCLILASFSETWGLVVNEAMACGLPVIVSNQCGCSNSLVKESLNGWTFSPYEPEQLTKLMLQMANQHDQNLERMGAESASIISHWGLDRFCKGVWDAIETCKNDSWGYRSLLDRMILYLWRGRIQSKDH